MTEIDTNLLIQGGIFGTVGILVSVKLLTSYFKKLFNLHGRWVMGMTLVLSTYAVATAMLSVWYPIAGMVFMGVYLTILVASTADAYFQQDDQIERERSTESPQNKWRESSNIR